MMSAVLMLGLALAVGGESTSRCALCHPDVKVEFERSIHHGERVDCVSCHGGDPGAVSVEAAHRGRFRGTPRRRDIPALCGECHSNPELVRPYNLPSNQLALYQTSQHGKLLAEGDETVAVCTDCHGSHEIRKTQDPLSRVFVRNIPQTCGRCHGKDGPAPPQGDEGDPYTAYSESVHGRSLLQDGNLSAPQCSSCHGAHGAAPAGLGDVEKICGHCHGTTRAYFLQGPHWKGMDEAGLPECAACHDHHRVMGTSLDMLDSLCSKCHEENSAPRELSTKMKTVYVQAAEELDQAGRLVAKAETIPLYVEDYRARLEEGRSALQQALPVMHSLDFGQVEDLTRRARALGREVESEVSGKLEGRKWRRVGLLVFWFYLLLTVAILFRFKRRGSMEVPP